MRYLVVGMCCLASTVIGECRPALSPSVVPAAEAATILGGATCYFYGNTNVCEYFEEHTCSEYLPCVDGECQDTHVHQPFTWWADECEDETDGWPFGNEFPVSTCLRAVH